MHLLLHGVHVRRPAAEQNNQSAKSSRVLSFPSDLWQHYGKVGTDRGSSLYGFCHKARLYLAAADSFMLAFDMGLAVVADFDVQGHGVAAHRAVFDVILP